MVRIRKIIIFMFGIACLLAQPLKADLVVNEIMANEPGDQIVLEWIEIHNNSTGSQFLGFFSININGQSFALPDSGVAGDEFFIISQDKLAFEAYWGNASGIWGDDTEREDYSVFQINGFSLPDETGFVDLRFGGNLVSILYWHEIGDDGVSWERIHPDSADALPSMHPSGSSPGRVNAVTPLDYDLALISIDVSLTYFGDTQLDILLTNRGLENMPEGDIIVSYDPDSDLVALPVDMIARIDYPATIPDDTISISTYFELPGIYPLLLLELPDDDRDYNNKQLVRAYGIEYPPVIISEFLADPKDPLATEWVELKNRTAEPINLKEWYLGDGIRFSRIAEADYMLPAGGYLVLCRDAMDFENYYGFTPVDLIELSSWPTLNNDGDKVRLRDEIGTVADSLIYGYTFGGNYSWGRSEEEGKSDRWGRSTEVGGTPGEANEVYLEAAGTDITIDITPNPFSPTLDGFTTLEFENPPGEEMIIRIYDTAGRTVRTLLDNVPSFDGRIEWFGTDDDGHILPAGIYIVYIEISGVANHKHTVVIAP